MKRKIFTEEEKKDILKEIVNVKDIPTIANKHNIHFTTIYSWRNKYEKTDKVNRNNKVTFKTSDEELKVLKLKCKNLGFEKDVSHYIRKVLFSKHITSDNPNGTIKELYKARAVLNKTGSNINQIANYSNFLLNQGYIEPEFAKELHKKMSDFLFDLDKQKTLIDSILIKI